MDDVRRARANAQLLDGSARRVTSVVTRLVGVQAQDDVAAGLSIRARTTGLTAADVTTAITDATLVLTWTLRGTRHLHHRDDVAWLLALFGPIFSRPTKRDADLGIAGAVGERAVAALRAALATDGPLTRAQVKEVLAPVGVDPKGQATIHVIRKAALAGILSVVPGDGDGGNGRERYAPLDPEPAPAAVPADQAAAELARRYLGGYGPATPADFAAWSGLGLRTAEAAWPARPAPVKPAAPTPLRLLGGFDNLLLGYADRTLHLPAALARRVNAGGGLVRPIVEEDGRVVGTWKYSGEIQPFLGEEFDVEAELADVRRFREGRPG